VRIHAAEQASLEALGRLGAARAASEAAQVQHQHSLAQSAEALEGAGDPLQRLGSLERTRAELEAAVQAAAVQAEAWRRDVLAQAREVERLRAEVVEPSEGWAEDQAEAPPQDPIWAAAEIGRAERRLKALGLINELAPTQLAEILERTEGLRAAHQDSLAARGHLEVVLAELQQRSGRRFRATLGEVTQEFETVWVELFGGGRATLEPTPGENGLGGGVDMVVQPQGKRPIPMPLLSGGERSLTALALVLALQKVSPSPFYVFDEVDAALDEANILNFAALIQRRSASSQFLVVTHSLTTMARASTLYGVTQDGAGSSRILSVRLTADGQTVSEAEQMELEGVVAGG
ncbi:MAG: chromosome segregation protein SMC, partial [Candidatus Dormibacteria bacterium]